MKVIQLKVGGLDDNFSYLLRDEDSGASALVDPCGDTAIIRSAVEKEAQLKPHFILITHGHHDHVSGVAAVKKFFPTPVLAHPKCQFPHEISVADRQKIPFGGTFIECLHTPGHSQDSVCYRLGDDSAIFTGDTLFIDCCGYCDAHTMFRTMRDVLWPLRDSNIVYSGHNYGRVPFATLGEERQSNPYLRITDFEQFKKELKKL
ncbi:MAG: hypothetical protein A2X49_08645 [Lentisphaerae bacterium GWF2_52_8]|nr:MAG: hypothetical protein A2X49_08645 [Lentisphaerae bacterium GWF2_52_8]